MSRTILFIATLLALVTPCAIHAQSTEADLKVRLEKKPLYLRGFWRDGKLKFDSTGQLIGTSQPNSFTLSGIEIRSVKLKPDRLVLAGDRIGLKFEKDVPKRVKLDEKVQIEIVVPQDKNYTSALDRILAENLNDLVPDLPSYWQGYAREHILHLPPLPKPAASMPIPEDKANRIGGGVKAPIPTSMPDPAFSSAARAAKLSGTVLVYLWVDRQGKPTHLAILRPLGLGLDEQALGAVSAYSFRPATNNGEPVTVEMNIEVNFQIF